jgi:hypothetical protein
MALLQQIFSLEFEQCWFDVSRSDTQQSPVQYAAPPQKGIEVAG